MDPGRGSLTEAQQRRLLELFGSELRAAVARRGGGDVALGEYLEGRRSVLGQCRGSRCVGEAEAEAAGAEAVGAEAVGSEAVGS